MASSAEALDDRRKRKWRRVMYSIFRRVLVEEDSMGVPYFVVTALEQDSRFTRGFRRTFSNIAPPQTAAGWREKIRRTTRTDPSDLTGL